MILPALAFFIKPMSCTLADAHGVHRQFLIASLSTFGISYGSLAILPFFKDPNDHDSDRLAWLFISVALGMGFLATCCTYCMNDALASNYARKHNLSYSRMRIWSSTGWAVGALVIMLVGDVSWLPFRVFGLLMLIVAIIVDVLMIYLWPYPEDFEMFHDGSTVEQRKLSIVGPNTVALMAKNRPRGSISRDMLERIRAGRSKSVGHLPRPAVSTIVSAGDGQQQTPVMSVKPKTKQEPEEQKEYTNFQAQMLLIKLIATAHKSLMRYLFLFVIFGIGQGAFWTYQMDYVKQKITRDDSEFEFISTLCMIAQSVFGEIIINIVATDLIRIFGANANMSLSLVALGLRCYFYCNILPLLGPYSIVIGEALQGPSSGLYWILIVDVGSNYALMVTDFMPEMKRRGIVRDRVHEEELSGCLRATMIGMMSSSMEGLGVAIGSLLGGFISGSLGYDAMWNMCAALSISVGFINITWDVVSKLLLKRDPKGKQKLREKAQQKRSNLEQFNRLNIPSVVIEDYNTNISAKL